MPYRRAPVYLDARVREAFLRAFVAEVRAERVLQDNGCLARREKPKPHRWPAALTCRLPAATLAATSR
jgi:hypothetical protein